MGHSPWATGGAVAATMILLLTVTRPRDAPLLFPDSSGMQRPLPVGAAVPALGSEGASAARAIVFVRSDCAYCGQLQTGLLTRKPAPADQNVLFVTQPAPDSTVSEERRQLERRVAERFPVLVDSTMAVTTRYRAWMVPMAYLVGDGGRVARVALGMQQSRQLIDGVIAR